jgi:hypothetical protein
LTHPLLAAVAAFASHIAPPADSHQINGLFERRASRYYGAFRRLKLQQGFSLCSLLNAFLRAYRARSSYSHFP